MNEPEPESSKFDFVQDSWGHILDWKTCEYCLVKHHVQQWDIADEDYDIISSIGLSYPFQIRTFMQEVNIHNRRVWVCVSCLSDIEEQQKV